jgi:hypothetical protein
VIRYYGWVAAERALTLAPGGDKVYEAVARVVNSANKGKGTKFLNSLPLVRRARQLVPPGGTIMDVGTGWYHNDAFLLWLAGDYRIILFDVKDKAHVDYIHNYLRTLDEHVDVLVDELGLDARETR